MISAGERPGVYIDYDASSVVAGESTKSAVAIAVKLYSSQKFKIFYSKSAFLADALIMNNTEVLNMGYAAFDSGAKAVYIIPANGTAKENYEIAFSCIDDLSGVGAIVTDSTNASVHSALSAFLSVSAGKQKEMIGFCCCSDVDSALTGAASFNSERMVLIGQGGVVTAAALAGSILSASVSDPLYGLPVKGAADIGNTLSEDRVNQMISGGVTPLETAGGKVYSIRTVSTRTKTGGEGDRSFLDLQTVRIIDYVLGSVRTALASMVGRARNNAKSRLAIATQAEIILQKMSDGGIIDSYDRIQVAASEEDPTVCIISLSFTVARGISRIYISATVSV